MHMLIRWLRRDCDWVSLLYEHLHERTNQTLHGTVAASFVTKLTCMGGVVRDRHRRISGFCFTSEIRLCSQARDRQAAMSSYLISFTLGNHGARSLQHSVSYPYSVFLVQTCLSACIILILFPE